MRKYNVLIYIGKEGNGIYEKANDEILFIHPMDGCNWGISEIKGDRFFDRMRMGWHDIGKVIKAHDGKIKELKSIVITHGDNGKDFRILSGSMKKIIEEIKKIKGLMEIIL
jgi:hypothetical protein